MWGRTNPRRHGTESAFANIAGQVLVRRVSKRDRRFRLRGGQESNLRLVRFSRKWGYLPMFRARDRRTIGVTPITDQG
jgi:hypothetical protein